jgi:hypothetical protein
MKKLMLFSAVMLLFVASCTQDRDIVIISPEIESDNTDGLFAITKIELTGAASVFYFDAYKLPHDDVWLRLAPTSALTDENGKQYKLTDCAGITLDSQVQIPQSGCLSFVLTFEPMDKNVKTVNFQAGDRDEDIFIKGVKLYEAPQTAKAVRCVLKGEVVNRSYSSHLVLSRGFEDRNNRTGSKYIPIIDGKFEYLINSDCEELYELTFLDEALNSSCFPIHFIAEQDTVHFTLYSALDCAKNTVKGGKLNDSYIPFESNLNSEFLPYWTDYRAKEDSLRESNKYHSAEAARLYNAIESADESEINALYVKLDKLRAEDKLITPEGKKLNAESARIYKMQADRKLEYATQHPDIAGYTALIDLIYSEIGDPDPDIDLTPAINVYETVFAPKYPKHPYTQMMMMMKIKN